MNILLVTLMKLGSRNPGGRTNVMTSVNEEIVWTDVESFQRRRVSERQKALGSF